MATKSILKTVHIKDSRAANRLVNALENAQKNPAKERHIKQKVTTASRSEIRSMFSDAK